MKKLVLPLLVFLVLAIAAVYIFIPANLVIVETVKINCVSDAAFRVLSTDSTWPKWWPGKINKAADGTASYQLNSTAFTVSQKLMNNVELLVHNNGQIASSHMSILNIPNDSAIIKWQYDVNSGNNPLQRIKVYRESLAVKKNMQSVLTAAQSFLSRFDNVYGFSFRQGSTTDTAIISTKGFSANYPSTSFIYGQIDKLKAFCNAGNCNITGIPMLNITPGDTSGYQVMVALPVENTQPGVSHEIKRQKMIPGQFIITDVMGGPYAISQTHQQLLHYFRDYHRTSMAIPFEYLVTDRLHEADTSKWITRIYSPVY